MIETVVVIGERPETVDAGLRYDARIRAYHAEIRRFYYPFVFDDTPINRGELENAPVFVP